MLVNREVISKLMWCYLVAKCFLSDKVCCFPSESVIFETTRDDKSTDWEICVGFSEFVDNSGILILSTL